MKLTLEKVLATARPEAKPSGWTSLDSQLKHFIDECGFRVEMITETNKGTYKCRELARRWGTLMWMFGLVYRIRKEYDGQILIERLGLTLEEDRQVVQALELLYIRFSNHENPTKNSATKMLYDQVASIGH